jgi:hypothetical protein
MNPVNLSFACMDSYIIKKQLLKLLMNPLFIARLWV